MHARATTNRVTPEQADQAIEQYRSALPSIREMPGNRGAILLVDRQNGRGIGITLWEDERALEDTREQANQLRQQVADRADIEIESVDEYEVAVWEFAG